MHCNALQHTQRASMQRYTIAQQYDFASLQWQRLVGSHNNQVSCAKEPHKNMALFTRQTRFSYLGSLQVSILILFFLSLSLSLSLSLFFPLALCHTHTHTQTKMTFCPFHRGNSNNTSPNTLELCNLLQCVAVCCSVLQCVALCGSVLQCVAVSCSELQ